MKRIVLIALACAFAPLATAQLYKSVGPDGKVIYSDQPPANTESKQINVQPAPGPAQKSAVERDKDAEKLREAARERAKKADTVSKNDEIRQARCAQARGLYQTYTEGGKIAKTNDKGERVLLNDDELEAERKKARDVMEEACKK